LRRGSPGLALLRHRLRGGATADHTDKGLVATPATALVFGGARIPWLPLPPIPSRGTARTLTLSQSCMLMSLPHSKYKW
jgi:hypothetical protein